MKSLKLLLILYLVFGLFPYKNLVRAEVKNPNDFKILSNDNKSLSISNVKNFLKQGDSLIKDGEFDKAKEFYLDARKLAKELASFYSDLNTAFIGVDARIPAEMQKKGRETLEVLAETNERLAAFYIKDKKPEVAVPILIEIIRIMSPNSPEGKSAYKKLMELGFVETKYRG